MLDYKSFFGLAVCVPGQLKYALVGFHPEPHFFDDEAFQWQARLCAAQISQLLERLTIAPHREAHAMLASTGMALESLSHELFSDISGYNADAHLLKRLLGNPALTNEAKFTEGIELAGKVAAGLATSTHKIAALRGCKAEQRPVCVQECLKRAADACQAVCNKMLQPGDRIWISPPKWDKGTEVYAKAPPAALIIVFFNLYLNAIQQMQLMRAVRTSGKVWHTFEHSPGDGTAGWAVIHIHDTGPGIHRGDFASVMQPGYTTKPGGTGLGLHICRYLLSKISDRLANRERLASLTISRSVMWNGTTFAIKLPLVSKTQ
jgi:signal transduction histidine kinase